MSSHTTLSLKITQASLNQTALDWANNMANIFAAIDEAAEQKSDMLLTPELSLTGYEVGDDFQKTDNDRIFEALHDIAQYAKTRAPEMIVTIGHPWRQQYRTALIDAASHFEITKNVFFDRLERPFNVMSLLLDGQIQGMTAKAHLFNNERGYEGRYFNEFSFRDAEEIAECLALPYSYGTFPITLPNGETTIFGRPLFGVQNEQGKGYIHAQSICEEKWVCAPTSPLENTSIFERSNIIPTIQRHLGSKDGLMLEIANASPPARNKYEQHIALNTLASNYADIVIDTDGLGTSGATFAQFGHQIITQNSTLKSTAPRASFQNILLTTSIIQMKNAAPSSIEKTHKILNKNFNVTVKDEDLRICRDTEKHAWDTHKNSNRWIEERIRNNALWMFDYMRKTRACGIAEAISGGKDSAFNCAMVRVMVELAFDELGLAGFCKAMPHLPYLENIRQAHENEGQKAAIITCINHMLTAVYMGTDNSSAETFQAAHSLICGNVEGTQNYDGIGGKFLSRNIQDLVTQCALTYGCEDSTNIDDKRKNILIKKLSDFVHISPNQHTQKDIEKIVTNIQDSFPELNALTSAALPGHSVAYENFQARLREVLIMAIANVENKMAVANPNLDEAYGAYATFGGDLHSGTVNWNAGLHKADQEKILEYLEKHGVHGIMPPITALRLANANRPTAELQPKENGKVIQFDDEAMEGSFEQKRCLARLMHHTDTQTRHGKKRLTASDIFILAKENDAFNGLKDDDIFNTIAVFYHRWNIAQHKIHASPIAPTFGQNVDKQTSLRTPNISGGGIDEILILAVDILFEWAKKDGLNWDPKTQKMLHKNSWQNPDFCNEFMYALHKKNADKNRSYTLKILYKSLQESECWHTCFPTLNTHH